MIEQTVAEFGGIDLLVVNAGSFGTRQTVAESEPEQWRTPIEVNLFGAYYCVRAAIPYLQAREGAKIIFIGSGARSRGGNGCSAYTCAKAALWGLLQALAQELLPSGICVNELIPGPVETDLLSQIQAGQGRAPTAKDEWFKAPADVAPLALFLAVQPALGPTGQSYNLGRRGM